MPVLSTQSHSGGHAGSAPAPLTEIRRILKLQVPVIVKLAERKLSMSEVMRLGTGAIIEFSKSSEEPLELMVNNKTIAVGQTVKVGENFGLKVSKIGDLRDIILSMGAK
jgi:flagellar motor switch protein FliN